MTAISHIHSYERQYGPSPLHSSANMRDDKPSPYAQAYPQKPSAERVAHRAHAKQPLGSHHLAERSDTTTRPREVARRVFETRQDERYLTRQPPPTPPWYQRASRYAHPLDAPAPSLSGSMSISNTPAPRGLSGAFSGAWSSARSTSAYDSRPTSDAWIQARESSDSGLDEEEGSMASDDVYPGERAPLARRSGSSVDVQQLVGLRVTSRILPELPNSAADQSQSEPIFLNASTRRNSPQTSASERQRDRADNWESESVRLPPLRSYAPKRASEDHSPYADRPLPPAKRACVQLPALLPFIDPLIQSSRNGSFSDFFPGRSRQDTVSPPPSPTPSAASWSSSAHSGGQTDTDPTDDEDVPMSAPRRDANLPSRMTPRGPRTAAARSRAGERELACPSPLLGEAADYPSATPLPADLSAHVSRALATADEQRSHASLDASKPRRRARARATAPNAPPQRKYRFVASRLSGNVSRRHSPDARDEQEGDHGRSPSPSSSSSLDIPLATMLPSSSGSRVSQPHASPPPPPQPQVQSRTPADPPKRRGRPPRPAYYDESLAPIDPDSPEGKGQFPVYCLDERPTQCQFRGCATSLSGKKAETTAHLKEHFQKADNGPLLCPWEAILDNGERVPCGMEFSDSANMGRHVSTKHLQSEKYQCGKCARDFARRDAALRHMKTMCSPEKEQRRAARRKSETDMDMEDGNNDAKQSGPSQRRGGSM